jgi:hypothetical protein
MGQEVRASYGASLSPDATAFAHLIDDGGYPRAVQRFLRGWRASLSRDVELPVDGPVSRVIHSADGQWLACEVAPSGGTRSQIWVVTTDPDDRMARRIDGEDAGTAELISWDGTLVAAILTGEDGVGISCLIDPADGRRTVLDRRSGGRLVDAWAGAALIRVGPRGYHEMIMLHGQSEIALLPADPGSTTADGVILDDHQPRRIRHGPDGELTQLYHPGAGGYVRALIRSDNGCEHARLLEVTATPDGVSYYVVAERPDRDLDAFAVSDDLSTVALLWNLQGRSELQILEYSDNTLSEPIPLPGLVASELSISAGGSMVAMTVEGPSTPRTVELVDPRSRQWEPVDREPSRGPVIPGFSAATAPQTITARDGLTLNAWLYRPASGTGGAVIYLHGGPEGQARPGYSEIFARLVDDGIAVLAPNVLRPRRRQGQAVRRHRRRRRLCALSGGQRPGRPEADRLRRLVLRRLPDAGGTDVSPCVVRGRDQHLRDERPHDVLPAYRAVDRRRGVSQVRPPRARSRPARGVVSAAPCRRIDRAPAGGARRQGHQRAGQRIGADRRSRATRWPRRPLPALQRRRARDRQAGESGGVGHRDE